MKNIALIILAVGIGISASYGARLAPELHDQTVIQGRAQFLQADTAAAHAAYCEARAEAELSEADGCGDHSLDAPSVQEDATASAYEEAWQGHLRGLRAEGGDLAANLAALRGAWLDALDQQITPSAEAHGLTPPSPTSRVGSWFGVSGMMFLFGLVLIVIGAVLGRKATREEALASGGGDSEGAAAKDFGVLLGELADEIGQLAHLVKEDGRPEESTFEHIKTQIEEMQVTKFQPLIDSRARVQARYGMAAFADIFGPLSSAERKMNRSWAALVDRHWGETKVSVLGAHTEVLRAQEALNGAVDA